MAAVGGDVLLKLLGTTLCAGSWGHFTMGRDELGPSILSLDLNHSARQTLVGWYQGCFFYFILGINAFRVAAVKGRPLTRSDWAILLVEAIFHGFSAYSLPNPARTFSLACLSLLLGGMALKQNSHDVVKQKKKK